MKNEILDELESGDYPKYGIKSYQQFLYSFSVLSVFIFLIFVFASALASTLGLGILSLIPFLLILSAFVSNILGLNNALKSKRNKERPHWKKTIGRIGNIVLGIFFLLLFLVFIWMFI